MPVGSVGKWLVLGTLVATLGAGGCKEDDGGDEPVKDAGNTPTDAGNGGGTDSGSTADAGGAKDAGTAQDAAKDTGPVAMCGGKTCMEYSPSPGIVPAFPPGCAKSVADAEVCGLASVGAGAAPDSGAPAFLEKDAPGVASASCGMFLESKIEMPTDGGAADGGDSGIGNGLVDTKRTISLLGMMADVFLVYPGCCRPDGVCSIDTSKGTSVSSFGTNPSNGGFGCIDPKISFAAAPAALQQVPCDSTTGMIKAPASTDGGTDGGGASDAGADGGNS